MMKWQVIFFSFFFFSVHAQSPDWSIEKADEGWKEEYLVRKYFHNSELQRQWAWHLLAKHRFLGNEKVLDFGCGDGKITAEISYFIPEGKILGVDLSPIMINFAQRCFPETYFPNLAFRTTKEQDGEKFDLIVSFCVFHLVRQPIDTLIHLRSQLNPQGKMLLVIPVGNNPAFFQAAEEMFAKYQLKAPWSSLNGKKSLTMRTEEGCQTCLKEAGFEIKTFNVLHTPTAFYNREELIEWMVGTTTANWNIPVDQAFSFFADLVDRMVEIDPDAIHESGAYLMKLTYFEVIAQIS